MLLAASLSQTHPLSDDDDAGGFAGRHTAGATSSSPLFSALCLFAFRLSGPAVLSASPASFTHISGYEALPIFLAPSPIYPLLPFSLSLLVRRYVKGKKDERKTLERQTERRTKQEESHRVAKVKQKERRDKAI